MESREEIERQLERELDEELRDEMEAYLENENDFLHKHVLNRMNTGVSHQIALRKNLTTMNEVRKLKDRVIAIDRDIALKKQAIKKDTEKDQVMEDHRQKVSTLMRQMALDSNQERET